MTQTIANDVVKEIEERIKKLESVLRSKQAGVLQYLSPGLSREYIQDFFDKKGIVLRPELIPLYEWHNGVDFVAAKVKQPMISILPMGMFYSLDFMIHTREDLIEWNYMENPGDYLPLFGSGQDDLYLLKNETGEIFYLAPAIQIFGELEFRSISAMLDCVIECYEEEVLKIDPNKGLVVNYDEYENKKTQFMI